MKTEKMDQIKQETGEQKQGYVFQGKPQGQEEEMPRVKISGKDFIAACIAQYSIIFPFAIAVWLAFFLLLLFITKVWF